MNSGNNGIKKVFLNSGFYIFSALLVDAIGFVLLPLYLSFLDSAEYGKVSIANGFIDVIIILAALSLHMAVGRFYSDYQHNKKKVAQYYSSILIFVALISTACSVLCLWGRGFLEEYIFGGIDFYPVIVLVIISIPFRTLRNVHRAILRGMQCGGELALVNLIVFVLQAGLTIFFIGLMNYGAAGMLLAALITHILYFIFICIDLRAKNMLAFSFQWDLIKESLKYSVPIMPHNLSSYIATLVSRVLLNNFFNTSTVGLYSVASQFGIVLDTVESSANNAFTPWFFNYKKDYDRNCNSVNLIVRVLSAFYGFCLLGIGLFSQEVILLFTDTQYADAWKVIPFIVTAFGVKAIYFFYLNILLYYKEASKKLFVATTIGNLINVIMSAFLTPLWGMYGTAIALTLAQLFIASIVLIFSRKYDTESIKLFDMGQSLLIAFAFMIVGIIPSYIMVGNKVGIGNLVIKLIILVLYVMVCFWRNYKMVRLVGKTLKEKLRMKKKISGI